MWIGCVVLLAFISFSKSYDPMENPNLFEGDMILSPKQLAEVKFGRFNEDVSLAATKTNLWPRTIPFDYHEMKWHGNGRHAIDSAIKAFEKHTCLRFVERTNEKGYLKFYNRGGCSTHVGYTGRVRNIFLGSGCWYPHIAMHEMMHALGFYHEQTRPDRDDYVKIHVENMMQSTTSQFKKRAKSEIDSLGEPYDYLSIMHYRKTAFSKNGKITIETIDKSKQDLIGEQKTLSASDIIQINKLYRCHEPLVTTAVPQRTTLDPKCIDQSSQCYRHSDKCSRPVSDAWNVWVRKNCRQTCGFCTDSSIFHHQDDSSIVYTNDCKDSLVNCDAYRPHCSVKSWADFMNRHCKETCGLCGVPPTRPPTDCYDLADCTGFVARGYCKPTAPSYFYRYMKKNCIKSCGWCNTKTPFTPKGTSPPWPKECGVSSVPMSRVIGGKEATPGSWPWQARLYKTNSSASYCGASLISATWLVTAAHCVKGKKAHEITVNLGVHSLAILDKHVQQIPVQLIHVNPKYGTPTRMNNDVALLKLARPAILNDRVKTVCIPERNKPPRVGEKCYLTGWGKTSHPGKASLTLQQTDLNIVDNTVCRALNSWYYRIQITKSMVCAGNGQKDIKSGCHGDSGGPLVCKQNGRFVLHGDVSWGSHICDTSRGYTVFGRISSFRQWMDNYIYT